MRPYEPPRESGQQYDSYHAANVSEISIHCGFGRIPYLNNMDGLLRVADAATAIFFIIFSLEGIKGPF